MIYMLLLPTLLLRVVTLNSDNCRTLVVHFQIFIRVFWCDLFWVTSVRRFEGFAVTKASDVHITSVMVLIL
jgi:polyphosphate kinase